MRDEDDRRRAVTKQRTLREGDEQPEPDRVQRPSAAARSLLAVA